MGFPIYGQKGVTHWDREHAFPGVTLYTPIGGERVHLVDMDGVVVHEWTPPEGMKPFYGFLRDNGNLLVRCHTGAEPWQMGGFAGVMLEQDWDGNVLWRYDNPVMHHDHIVLRNGNIMVIGWEVIPPGVAARVQGGVLPAPETTRGRCLATSCWN